MKEFVQRDIIYIVVCLFALLACLYTVLTIETYQEQCNQYCLEYIDTCECNCENEYIPFDDNYSFLKPLTKENENPYQSKDTKR